MRNGRLAPTEVNAIVDLRRDARVMRHRPVLRVVATQRSWLARETVQVFVSVPVRETLKTARSAVAAPAAPHVRKSTHASTDPTPISRSNAPVLKHRSR